MTDIFPHPDMPMAVSEEPRQYLLRVELPGLARSQVGVQVQERMLHILGGRQQPVSSRSENPGHREVMSALRLPEDVDACSVVADFRNGVLQVRLPRTMSQRRRSWWPC